MGRWEFNPRRSSLRAAVLLLAFLGLIIGFAGPRFGWQWIEVRSQGMDIVVALDVSKSMLANDLAPSRLERARRMVIDLMAEAATDRIGLVLFAGEAFVQCPLTSDHQALRLFLDQLSPDLIPVGGTNLESALRESLRALDAGGEGKGKGKLVVLLTDGEDHRGNLGGVMDEVAKSEVKVITVGMASPSGGPILDADGGYIKDRAGNVVVSKLDEASLKSIAEKSGGEYLSAAEAGASVSDIYKNKLAPRGHVTDGEARKERLWNEVYQWFMVPVLVLLLIETMLTEARVTGLLLCAAALWFVPADVSFAAGSDVSRYNEAVAAMDAGDQNGAQKIFEELSVSATGEARRRSLYNLANLLAGAGRLDDAAKLYREALTMDYQDQQVRDNLAWADKAIENKKNKRDQNQESRDKGDPKKPDSDPPKDDKSKSAGDEKKAPPESGDKNKKQPDQAPDQDKKKDSGDSKQQDEKQPDPEPSQGKQAQPQNGEMSKEEAEKLLRAAKDDRKSMVPVFRGQKVEQTENYDDW